MTGPRARAALGAVLSVGLAAAVVGCGGIPSDESPSLIAQEAVPEELSRSSTTTVPVRSVPGYLYLVLAPPDREELLVSCAVDVDRGDVEGEAAEAVVVLRALIELVPADSTCFPGLVNAVPPDLELLGAEVQDRILVLDLANLTEVQGVAARRAVAQIVWTATEVPGIDGVRFLQDGEDIAVNVSEGRTLSEGQAVSRSDFPSLAAVEDEATTTTTTTTAPPPTAAPPVDGAPPAP